MNKFLGKFGDIVLIFIMFTAFNACSLNDNDQPMPAFMLVSDPVVETLINQGDGTHKITDVWVFQNGKISGIFPLPAKVPVNVVNGGSDILIFAGIRNNGINGNPIFYPFYKSIETRVNPENGEIFSVPLKFSYNSDAVYSLAEGFETGNSFTFDSDQNPQTNLTVTDEDASTGTKSGKVVLTQQFPNIETATNQTFFKVNNRGGASYVELDYKGNAEIAVGLIKFEGQRGTIAYKVIIPPRLNWNKIYIDLTEELSLTDYDSYKIAIGFSKPSSLTEATVFIDNVKHIHF
ncbi:MAG: hypothetical protein IPM42_18700 [Saprospiraceae bacterium]|nr:hypothetical protein [Saprospiraceae bacterium]